MLKINTTKGQMVITDDNKTLTSDFLKEEINNNIILEDGKDKPELGELEDLDNSDE